jgi:regulator of protease activity HflC (stomatin/prohibitin superfamily)
VSIGITLNYRIVNAVDLYKHIGTDFNKIIIDPYAQETTKAVIAKFTAENLIQYRHDAKDMVYNELRDRLATLYIDLVDINFVHLDFSPDFIRAVESKQIALQHSITAKNLTEKVNEESLQTMRRADAEAYSLRIKKESATPALIELKKIEALSKAVDKWDGVLPSTMTGMMSLLKMGE